MSSVSTIFAHKYSNFCIRSIPNCIDGLKPSNRKILYGAFKRNLTSEIKVAQLAGYISEVSSYHHGEVSLQGAIIKMAQDYTGSNNVNLLEPIGQFGTRLLGGNDHASPRYIFTKLSPLARLIFPKDDDILLNYLEDDGRSIEPSNYCPIIPLLLVNGAQGIGSGWSTSIPSYCPLKVCAHIRAKLDEYDEPGKVISIAPLEPYVRGFKGEILSREDGQGFITRGLAKRVSKTMVEITELPVGMWTGKYKNYLMKKQAKGKISSFSENHTTTDVSFKIRMSASMLEKAEKYDLVKSFGLENNILTTNMHAFDSAKVIKKYQSVENILDDYFPVRLNLYQQRKKLSLNFLEYKNSLLSNKATFIEMVADGKLDFVLGSVKTKQYTLDKLRQYGFDELSVLKKKQDIYLSINESISSLEEYDYLLNMPLSSFTAEKVARLQVEASEAQRELMELQSMTITNLWRKDLDKLEDFLNSNWVKSE